LSPDKPRRAIRFQLTWRGLFGVAMLVFCLFLWMFILGLWAGQTILPASGPAVTPNAAPAPVDSSSR
jgi:hypothetical protein